MNWKEEISKRISEAQELRRELSTVGLTLVELQAHLRARQGELDAIKAERGTLTSELWMRWVRTEEAQEPDPRTRRTNEEWRNHLWGEARQRAAQEDERLGRLDEVAGTAREEVVAQTGEIELHRIRASILVGQMELLAAELNCLASVGREID